MVLEPGVGSVGGGVMSVKILKQLEINPVKYNPDLCSTIPMLSSCYFVSNIVIRKLTFCLVTVILLSPISLLDVASKHYEQSMYKFCGSDKLKQSVFWLP